MILRSRQNDGFVKSSPAAGGTRREKIIIVGAIHESPLSRVSRDNDEIESQSRFERDRWTFYETIRIPKKEVVWI